MFYLKLCSKVRLASLQFPKVRGCLNLNNSTDIFTDGNKNRINLPSQFGNSVRKYCIDKWYFLTEITANLTGSLELVFTLVLAVLLSIIEQIFYTHSITVIPTKTL